MILYLAMMTKILNSFCAILLLFSFVIQDACIAQNAPTAQIGRSQELIEKDRALRERIARDEKFFIKKIIVKGSGLSEEKIEEITAPFKNHWLSREDIDSLLAIIKNACIENGYQEDSFKIVYRVSKATLNIEINT